MDSKPPKNALERITEIANEYSASLEVDEASDGSYVDCIIDHNDLDLSVTLTRFHDNIYAYSLESTILPRDLYPDEIKQTSITPEDRSDEIINNVRLLLSRGILFVRSPSIFNKDRGYITISVDGKANKIYYKDNSLRFNTNPVVR